MAENHHLATNTLSRWRLTRVLNDNSQGKTEQQHMDLHRQHKALGSALAVSCKMCSMPLVLQGFGKPHRCKPAPQRSLPSKLHVHKATRLEPARQEDKICRPHQQPLLPLHDRTCPGKEPVREPRLQGLKGLNEKLIKTLHYKNC